MSAMPTTDSTPRSTNGYTARRMIAISAMNSRSSSSVLHRFDRICCWSVTYFSNETCGAARTASSSSSKNSASEKSPNFATMLLGTVFCVALYWATVLL